MSSFKNALCMSASTLILAGYADALDLAHPLPTTHTHTLELKPIQSDGIQLAGVYFLPDFSDDSFADYSDIGRNYNTGVCQDPKTLFTTSNCTYPRTVDKKFLCPFSPGYYRKCSCLPQFKISSCPSPKYLSSPQCDGKAERCLCPSTVYLTQPNDRCIKYCDGACIDKSCTPLKSETGCAYGTNTVTNNCGGTRTVCKPCASGGSASCSGQTTACSSSQVQTSTCKDCFGTTRYSCRAKTCSEKGLKDCNGTCIATSACCGCSSSQVCYNASCCSPLPNETGCQYGSYSASNNCGGTRTVCKACASGGSASCSGQTTACSSDQVQTSTCKDCFGSTHYSCRTKTCSEKGLKDCNGSCIATSACCGCSSAQVCYNSSCCTPLKSETGCQHGTNTVTNNCGGTRTVCKGCTPLPSETSCQYGTTSGSDGCGGTRTVCKGCATGGSTSCSGQTTACSSSQVQTSTCKDCSGTTHYSCRTKTCSEKGMKDCNGTCISLSACCGCSSAQVCYNSSCCTPLKSETGCQHGTNTVTNNCGGTRTVCKSCSLTACSSISSKPANSSYTTKSCTDCSGTKTVNTGWTCNSGYTKSGSSCIKACTSPKVASGNSCVCPSKYQYTSSNCNDMLAGSSCDGKYTDCVTPSCSDGGYYASPMSGYSCTPITYQGTACYDCVPSTGGGGTDSGSGTTCSGELVPSGNVCICPAQYKYDHDNCKANVGQANVGGNSCDDVYGRHWDDCISHAPSHML